MDEAEAPDPRMCMLVMGDLGSPSLVRSVKMEWRVWSRLPEGVLEEVLRRLPIGAQLRFRAVCKRWLQILTCPSFLWDCVPIVPPPTSIFAMDSRLLVEAEEEKFLPGTINCYLLKPLRSLRHLFPCASDSGLICLLHFSAHVHSLFLLNPMSRTWRELPKPHIHVSSLPPLVALIADTASKSYQVVVAAAPEGDPWGLWNLQLYHSRTDSWSSLGTVSARIKPSRPAYCHGNLYFLRWDCRLLAIRLLDGVQTHMALPTHAIQDCACLSVQEGQLILVGIIAGSFTSYCIWRMQAVGSGWEKVAVLQERCFELLFPLCGGRGHEWAVFCVHDSVVLDLRVYDFVQEEPPEVEAHGRRVLLAYNLSLRAWYIMPFSFLDPPGRRTRLLLPFQPRLDLIV